jgi:protein involved in polysaccharide export with SLBB domain
MSAHAAQPYTVQCPDALEIVVAGRPQLCGVQPVGPDGRLDLGRLGRLRVEGRTPAEVASQLAVVAGVADDQVQVRVAQYNSRQIYVYGQVSGSQRSVPYQGPETVVHLLKRAGGVTTGAAANEVYVIRPRIAEGKPPQVFPVNLREIVAGGNEKTKLILQPNDEVYVGETRQSYFEKCVPPCLRPFFDAVCGFTWLQPRAERHEPSPASRIEPTQP